MLPLLTFATESDRDVFTYLYERYKKLLLHKAFEILHDAALAEDATSEAYIRVYKNLHKIDDPTSNQSIAFLVTIVKNVALTMRTKENKMAYIPFDDIQADAEDVEESVLAQLSAERIHAIVEQIGEEYRAVFVLKYAHDCSHKEIGRLLNISENNVTVRLHRAKKKLAELLAKEGYTREG